MKSTTQAYSLPRMLTWLTAFFVTAQILYFILSIFTNGIIHIIAAQTITLELLKAPVVFMPLLVYLSSQILIYGCFIFLVWYAANAAGKIFSLRKDSIYSLGIMLWIISAAFILSANSIYFKQSLFAMSTVIAKAIFWFTAITLSTFILLTILHLLSVIFKKTTAAKDICALILIAAFGIFYTDAPSRFLKQTGLTHANSKQPNIFIVSVEALRPDFIFQQQAMPFLVESLQNSIQFTDAYTPIAQSFPSWISILTGKTPMHHGARSFYANYTKLNLQDSLTNTLKQQGYETMYAVDGQRFGDITTQLGFDRIISPPYGAAELIIGSMSDFPLSNLLMKAHIGKYLFPYNFANRTIAATYHPDDFIDLITSQLETRSNKPLFFSVHFGISHWPYRYADDDDHDSDTLSDKYRRSLQAADAQMKKFFDYLKAAKLLEHAIVVFVSDHGTGLGMPGDSLTDEKSYVGKKRLFSLLPRLPYSNNKREGIDTSYGYSTNILSLQQYHVLMAIKTFGVSIGHPKKIKERVSLMDITPTLMEFLHLRIPKSTDGISLLDTIKNSRAAKRVRKFFFENGFTSPEIAKAEISATTVLKDAIHTVELDTQTGLLHLNDHAEKQLLKQKQRALLTGDWLLARQSPTVMILANIRSGEWTMDMDSDFAKRANIRELMRDFRQYNESEI